MSLELKEKLEDLNNYFDGIEYRYLLLDKNSLISADKEITYIINNLIDCIKKIKEEDKKPFEYLIIKASKLNSLIKNRISLY
jgi:hypothetical protein